jgi:hypothetical protein
MSKKTKAGKGHSIKNPIMFNVVIDTDDDFTVDGERHLSRNITVTKEGDATQNLVDALLGLHYESSGRNSVKVADFKKLLGSFDFKEAVKKLMYHKDSLDYTTRVSAGGNHTIVVTLPE